MRAEQQDRVTGWRAAQLVQSAEYQSVEVPEFEGVVNLDDSGVTVRLCGELDLATAPAADELLRQAARDPGTVTLDLRDLSFMDCAGMNIVIAADIRLRETARRLVIVHVQARVRRLFELTGITERLQLIVEPLTRSPQSLAITAPTRSPNRR